MTLSAQTTLPMGDVPFEGTLFSKHYLQHHLPSSKYWAKIKKESKEAWEKIKAIYGEKGSQMKIYDESELEEEVVKPLLRVLGHIIDVQPPQKSTHGIEYKPDYGFFETNDQKDEAIKLRSAKKTDEYFKLCIGIGEAKACGVKLDKGRRENPSVKIKTYLRLSNVDWGILTNGKKWRIYSREAPFSSNLYYEIDLPRLLEHGSSEDFKYFYGFFSHQAFVLDGEKSFLDRLYEENIKFAGELGEDLKENVYECLRVFCEGFLRYNRELKEEDIKEIHDKTLILLYRLLFLFYAEARNLLPEKEEEYKGYSLHKLREQILDELDENKIILGRPDYWCRLKCLFKLVNEGSETIGLKEVYIPPYNGKLFDPKTHPFLDRYELPNECVAQGISFLGRRIKKGKKEFVDYSTLDIRDLGSIYEGLLEYKVEKAKESLKIVKKKGKETYEGVGDEEKADVKRGELYLVTDKGERKATGSYYTPKYIVKYIMENTLKPIVEKKLEEARNNKQKESDAILSVKVLDPAMGSGHFLVEAIDFLSQYLVEAIVNDVTKGLLPEQEYPPEWAKREVARHCIYGVDLNPMAVELAKVAVWLKTISIDKPLSFLDHKLKCGNSLIGAKLSDLKYYPKVKKKLKEDTTLPGFISKIFIDKLIGKIKELEEIKEEKLDDVKKKEKVFEEFKELDEYKKTKAIADVYTSVYFGNEVIPTQQKDAANVYYDLIYLLDHPSNWEPKTRMQWFKNAMEISQAKRFFHWELEFPEIFFEEGKIKENPGFDAVVGNPPYVNIREMSKAGMDDQKEYFKIIYQTAFKCYDLYVIFVERGLQLLQRNGAFSYIVPNKFMVDDYGLRLRDLILSNFIVKEIVDVSTENVFPDSSIYPHLIFIEKTESSLNDPSVKIVYGLRENKGQREISTDFFRKFDGNIFAIHFTDDELAIVEKLLSTGVMLSTICDLHSGTTGFEANNMARCIVDGKPQTPQEYVRFIVTGSIDRYLINLKNTVYLHKKFKEPFAILDKDIISDGKIALFKSPKIVFGGMTTKIEASYDEGGYALGVNVFAATNFDQVSPNYLLSLLNSKLLSFYYTVVYRAKHLAGGFLAINKRQLENIPIYPIQFRTSKKDRANHIKQVESMYESKDFDGILSMAGTYTDDKSANIVHDILDFLAEQMIKMNKKKQKLEKALDPFKYLDKGLGSEKFMDIFKEEVKYAELLNEEEVMSSHHDIDGLRIEKEDEKWVLSVQVKMRAQDEDGEWTNKWVRDGNEIKREWRKLYAFDEKDLSEEKARYYQIVFNHLGEFENYYLPGGKGRSVEVKIKLLSLPKFDNSIDLSDYIDVKKELEELKKKIWKTDWLIDQNVYKLYGLTDNEIKIVEKSLER